jgi:hypothetical protein
MDLKKILLFIIASYWGIMWGAFIQYVPILPFIKINFKFSEILCTFPTSCMCMTCHASTISIDLITLIKSNNNRNYQYSNFAAFSSPKVISFVLGPNILLRTPSWYTHNLFLFTILIHNPCSDICSFIIVTLQSFGFRFEVRRYKILKSSEYYVTFPEVSIKKTGKRQDMRANLYGLSRRTRWRTVTDS